MVRSRVVETEEGIQGEFDVDMYDEMMRRLRDKGWLEVKAIFNAGISSGLALEVGPGPGYLGLEWLKRTEGTSLKGLDISPGMIEVATRNAKEYHLENRVEYVESNARKMPFEDNTFDGVFTNGSLHEWSEPKKVLSEICRVLKPKGRYCISDLRRDMNPIMRWLMQLATKPRQMRPGLTSSINAAYTVEEIKEILKEMKLTDPLVTKNAIGLVLVGQKKV